MFLRSTTSSIERSSLLESEEVDAFFYIFKKNIVDLLMRVIIILTAFLKKEFISFEPTSEDNF